MTVESAEGSTRPPSARRPISNCQSRKSSRQMRRTGMAKLPAHVQSPDDPKTYLSLGADFRERFEANDAANFGVSGNHNNDYIISRTEWHADLHIAGQVQVFAQFESDFAPWKTTLTPADQDAVSYTHLTLPTIYSV